MTRSSDYYDEKDYGPIYSPYSIPQERYMSPNRPLHNTQSTYTSTSRSTTANSEKVPPTAFSTSSGMGAGVAVSALGEGFRLREMDKDQDRYAAFGFVEGLDLDDTGIREEDLDDVRYTAANLDLEEAKAIIRKTIADNALDPNFPQALLHKAALALRSSDLDPQSAAAVVEEIKLEAALMDDSPYVEVRSVVPNTDDISIPANTFRVWTLGLLFATVGTGINVFFAARSPSINLSVFCAQVLCYPLAKAMEWWLPRRQFKTFGYKWSFNPGPFNQKEHMLITIMANVTFGGAYVTDIVVVQRLPIYFNNNTLGKNAVYQILIALSTQLLGFSVAGLTRRFLVYPPSMIWPNNLAQIALNRSFHYDKNLPANGWRISRLRFFLVIFALHGLWFVIPNNLFQALSTFNWTVWIAPNNVHVAALTGTAFYNGLGLNPWPTFDWNQLSSLNNPLVSPLFSTCNQVAGMLGLGLAFIPALWYNNIWQTGYLPLNDNHLFDRNGNRYNVSRVLSSDHTLDKAAYDNYSPAYLGAANAMIYAFFFAFYTAGLVHAALYHYRPIIDGFRAMKDWKNPQSGYNDLHNRLMRNYREVPEYWFGCILVFSLVSGIVVVEIYDTQFPIWGFLICIALAFVFVIPAGMITAVGNVQITLNVIAELVGGYALPGKPLANMLFKSYGYLVTAQAITYASDLKLGHYLKIAPRLQFWTQTVATVWAAFVSLAVVNWQIVNIEGLCTPDQSAKFTCPGYNTFFSAAVVWGVIGPAKMYSQGGIYHACTYGFLIGAIAPVPFWFLARRYPRSWFKFVHIPAFFNGGLDWAPYNLSHLAFPGLWIAILFQYYIKKRYLAWWSKYNYILATALTSSVAIFGVIWYFSLQFVDREPDWWGNSVPWDNCDGRRCTRLKVPPEGFGPAVGEFHF